MPNRQYQSGVRWEREVKQYQENLGWEVIRASGSHGRFDLVCFKAGQRPLMIQCKVTAKDKEVDRLHKKFKVETKPEAYYIQSMWVKLKGIREPWVVTV